MKTVIVHGPRACGKTRNAARIAAYFGIDTIVDDWDERHHEITVGAIHLTNQPVRKTSFRSVNFADLQLPSVSLFGVKKVDPRYINKFQTVDRPKKAAALPIPTTLEGLKRQAVQLRKQSGCKHMAALEMVARSMGFRTYAAAKRHFDQIGGAA